MRRATLFLVAILGSAIPFAPACTQSEVEVDVKLRDGADRPVSCEALTDAAETIIRIENARGGIQDAGCEPGDVTVPVPTGLLDAKPITATVLARHHRDGRWEALTPALELQSGPSVTFRFAPLKIAFAPDGTCGPVTEFVVENLSLATGALAYGSRTFTCGEDRVLVTRDVAAEHHLTVKGFVPTAVGPRACFRASVGGAAGQQVIVPFAPAPEDEDACRGVESTCVAEETCDDGLDNDCNGRIDEGCACTAGAVDDCFSGAAGQRGVGACRDGTMTCAAAGGGGWGACEGEVAPRAERCDGLDNDCDGETDEGLGCTAAVACPASDTLPLASPFAPYVLDARTWIDPVLVASWRWTVEGGPCDRLLAQTTQQVSYTVEGAASPVLTFRPTLSGDYTVTLTIVTTSGETLECTFIVKVAALGLRVELCWGTTGNDDLDLHLHRPGSTTPWAVIPPASPDVCGWQNCAPGSPTAARVSWGLPTSMLHNCGGAGGPWAGLGHCPNPRLDLDNITTAGKPENINVDFPPDEATFRVAVHYYQHHEGPLSAARPLVNVYCHGERVATYGAAPDLVGGFIPSTSPQNGALWRVADIRTASTGDCSVTALHPPGQTTGYWVTTGGDLSY